MRRIVADPAAYGLEFSQISDEPYFAQVATGRADRSAGGRRDRRHQQDELYALNPPFIAGRLIRPDYSLLVPSRPPMAWSRRLLSPQRRAAHARPRATR